MATDGLALASNPPPLRKRSLTLEPLFRAETPLQEAGPIDPPTLLASEPYTSHNEHAMPILILGCVKSVAHKARA